MFHDYIEKISASTVYDVAIVSPLDFMPRLSQCMHNKIYLKREDLQPIFSFKLRGAYNKMCALTENERAQGVIAASAGNHAQGVALAAKRLAISAMIVMPTTTPAIKVEAVAQKGAEIRLYGDSYDDACLHAFALAKEQNRVFIHPYDDPDVIAGQGTIAAELIKQHPKPLDAVFIPVGGGGLLAGMAVYLKHFWPTTKIIAVEADDAACLYSALQAGERTVLEQVGLFADGTAVRQVGKENFRIVRDKVDEVIRVSSDEICAAVMDIFDDTRAIAEPSGALALAGMKNYIAREQPSGQHYATINSGANVNFDRLRHIAERAELGEKREVLLAVTIDEKPGSFLKFCQTLEGRSITEFNYRYANKEKAHIFVGIQTYSSAEQVSEQLTQLLLSKGYPCIDLTNNEMAKLHIRHMVGGRSTAILAERLYRFEFPERPGALLRFLSRMGGRWNITLFHYRNHGAAYGRVLIGVEVSDSQLTDFHHFIDLLGYRYWDETENTAYQQFLG